MVNDRFPARSIYGFEMVDTPGGPPISGVSAINRKFTPNRTIRVFSEFSPILSQCKYLRFIDDC
jgi:hypothetical protein